MIIPGETGIKPKGIAGIRINNKFLEDSLLPDIMSNIRNDVNAIMVLSDQGGRIIEGDSAYYNKSTNSLKK